MKRRYDIKSLVMLLIVLSLLADFFLYAGTTGKITGLVTDAETGEPLPGANIVLEDQLLGASADAEGYYVILNVPPGVYTVQVSMMGYADLRITDVRVRIDLTRRVNADLTPTVLESAEAITVVAERPLVQMDMTSSLFTMSANEIENLPVQTVTDVLELQAGVIKEGNDIHIRGGRSGEIAYWVDGVSATDVFAGGMGVTVENSAVEELQVISGTFNAEYGQAMSGIVNVITKEGGKTLQGNIKAYVGDYLTNASIYDVAERVDSEVDPVTGAVTAREETENPLTDINPSYDLELSLGGPLPFIKGKMGFFINGRFFSDEGYLYGRNWYTPAGIPGDSALMAMNPYENKSAQVKLHYNLRSNMKISYNLFWNRSDNDKFFNRVYKYNPGGVAEGHSCSNTHIISWNHVISPTTFYEVRLNRFYRNYEQYVHEDPNAVPNWFVHVPGDSLNPERIINLGTQEGQSEFEQIKQGGLDYSFFVDPNNAEGYVHPDSSRDPASYSFWRAGNDLSHFYRSTAYWVGKLDMTSQLTRMHQLKFGVEFRSYELTLDTYTLQAKREENSDEQVVPFVPVVPPLNTFFRDKYTRNPNEFSSYVQDKIELEDMVVNIGLRFDYFDANSVVPADPEDPNIYDPFKNEHIFKGWVEPAPDDVKTPADMEAYQAKYDRYTPEERRAFMHKEVDPKMQISPRLGIAYPISSKGLIHFSYGHFFQIPEFQYLYDSPDFKLNSGGGRTIIGNADLNAQRTVQYEIGFAQELVQDIGVDITLFYRDIRDWVGTSPPIQTVRPNVSYVIYENKDYSNVRGLTVKLEKRMSNHFYVRLDYSYHSVEGTYSHPNDAFNALQAQEEPRLSMIPLNWDQRHTLNGQFMFQFKGWTASLIGKYFTGMPFTPSFAKGARVGGTALTGLTTNSSRKPSINTYDIYLTRRIPISDLRLSLFLYVYNLFDQRGVTNVFSDTGTPAYTTYPRPGEVPYSPYRVGTVDDLMERPEWYVPPRQLQLGLSLGF